MNRSSGGVAASSNDTLKLSENITSYGAGEDAANSGYVAATASTGFPRLTLLRAFSNLADLLKTLDSNRGENLHRGFQNEQPVR